MEDALNLMEAPIPKIVQNSQPLRLGHAPSIELQNVSYRYSATAPWVIKEINLSIPAGSKVGFIGQTGCGKTTLLDLIMGLLDPTTGAIQINGVELIAENKGGWQANIAHVPQFIFLSDASIAENIAFGVSIENIDYQRVRDSAVRACIMDTINAWDDGLNTVIGERGIKLSGGQRQRIGIARALYKNATILVFDEATSALDGETEASVMHEINSLEFEGGTLFTVLMIAHRLTTLKNCSKIIEMEDGKIKRVCEYKDILAEKSNFSND
jgi:ATP-binding cassette subfamily B protein